MPCRPRAVGICHTWMTRGGCNRAAGYVCNHLSNAHAKRGLPHGMRIGSFCRRTWATGPCQVGHGVGCRRGGRAQPYLSNRRGVLPAASHAPAQVAVRLPAPAPLIKPFHELPFTLPACLQPAGPRHSPRPARCGAWELPCCGTRALRDGVAHLPSRERGCSFSRRLCHAASSMAGRPGVVHGLQRGAG